eukprot:m.168527 g.168527  ORF g.168527 m.168527 type:complete len:449 (+) comp9910_c1_seq9:664-2010(+)
MCCEDELCTYYASPASPLSRKSSLAGGHRPRDGIVLSRLRWVPFLGRLWSRGLCFCSFRPRCGGDRAVAVDHALVDEKLAIEVNGCRGNHRGSRLILLLVGTGGHGVPCIRQPGQLPVANVLVPHGCCLNLLLVLRWDEAVDDHHAEPQLLAEQLDGIEKLIHLLLPLPLQVVELRLRGALHVEDLLQILRLARLLVLQGGVFLFDVNLFVCNRLHLLPQLLFLLRVALQLGVGLLQQHGLRRKLIQQVLAADNDFVLQRLKLLGQRITLGLGLREHGLALLQLLRNLGLLLGSHLGLGLQRLAFVVDGRLQTRHLGRRHPSRPPPALLALGLAWLLGPALLASRAALLAIAGVPFVLCGFCIGVLELLLDALDLLLQLVQHGVLGVLVDLGLVLDLLGAVGVAQRADRLIEVVVRGSEVCDHDGLGVAAERVLQKARQLALAVRHVA